MDERKFAILDERVFDLAATKIPSLESRMAAVETRMEGLEDGQERLIQATHRTHKAVTEIRQYDKGELELAVREELRKTGAHRRNILFFSASIVLVILQIANLVM